MKKIFLLMVMILIGNAYTCFSQETLTYTYTYLTFATRVFEIRFVDSNSQKPGEIAEVLRETLLHKGWRQSNLEQKHNAIIPLNIIAIDVNEISIFYKRPDGKYNRAIVDIIDVSDDNLMVNEILDILKRVQESTSGREEMVI